MKTRYPLSRLVAIFLGAWSALIFHETVRSFLNGPPRGWMVCTGGFCWTEPSPLVDFSLAVAWESMAIVGTVLMWTRAGIGFIIAGMGYLLYLELGLVDYYCEGSS